MALLFTVALVHANARARREQEQTSDEHGWQFSKDSSPIQEDDWLQLSQNSRMAPLSSARARQNFTYGVQNGAQFVLFEAPGLNSAPHDSRGYEYMIAFHKSSKPSFAPHLTLGKESATWEQFPTDNWIFLRPKTPPWMVRAERIVSFVNDAYQQLQII